MTNILLKKFQHANFEQIIIVGICAFLSLLMVLPAIKTGGILAGGEHTLHLNPTNDEYFSVWDGQINLGFKNPANLTSMPFYYTWKLLETIDFIADPSVLFIFFITFFTALAFYKLVKNVIPAKSDFVYLPGIILYSYNVYRTLGLLDNRVAVLFFLMPLMFLYYYLLLNENKKVYIAHLLALSSISSFIGVNLPLFTILYILPFTYLVYYVVINFKIIKWKNILLTNFLLIIGFVLVNLYWIYPMTGYLLNIYNTSNEGKDLFSFISAGSYFEYFRFIGVWSWLESAFYAKYYPFAENYYKFPLNFISYTVVGISFLHLALVDKKKINKLAIYSVFLAVIALFFSAGINKPFGSAFQFLIDNIALFKMYRDPFNKFIVLFIFAAALSLTFSVIKLVDLFKDNFQKYTAILIITAFNIVLAYPLFNGTALPLTKWNALQRGYKTVVPPYWIEAKNYLEKNLGDYNVLAFPYNTYSSTNNWEFGSNVAGDVAQFVFSTKVIRASEQDLTVAKNIIDDLTEAHRLRTNFNLGKVLGILNTKYVLQENDKEWRYSSKISNPSHSEKYLTSQLGETTQTFGLFDDVTLNKIPNAEPNKFLKDEFIEKVSGKPILSLYKVPDDYLRNTIYVANDFWLGFGKKTDLKYLVSTNEFNSNSVANIIEENKDNYVVYEPSHYFSFGEEFECENYCINFSVPETACYTLFIEQEFIRNNSGNLENTFNGNTKKINVTTNANNYWSKVNDVCLEKNKTYKSNTGFTTKTANNLKQVENIQILNINPRSFISNENLIKYTEQAYRINEQQRVLNIEDVLVYEIPNLEIYKTYKLKLNIETEYKGYVVSVVQRVNIGGEDKYDALLYSGEYVNNGDTVAAVFETGDKIGRGFVVIHPIKYKNTKQIMNVESLALDNAEGPKMMLLAKAETSSNKNIAEIIAKKISSTEYEVKLNSFNSDQIIILNQNFDEGWEIENNEKHFIVNGFANGWVVSPENMEDSEFKIIYKEQHLIQIFRYITFITFFSCIGIIIYSSFKRTKL